MKAKDFEAYKAAMRDMRKEGIFMSLRNTDVKSHSSVRSSEITGSLCNRRTILK